MDVVVALHAAAAVLLVIAGLAKIAQPAPTAELLAAVGLAIRESTAVAIGVGEVVVGLGALAIGGPGFAVATGVLYLAFAGVVVTARGRGAASCGCFGRADAPPSWIHVVGNLVLAGASFAAAAGPTPLEVMDDQPAGGIGFVLMVGVLAGLALIAFTALPEALAARRGSPPAATPFRIELDQIDVEREAR